MNAKSIFAKILPTIAATVIPGGPLAQMGISLLASALGVDKIDPTPDAMDAAIIEAQSKNPDVLLQLKKADAELQVRLAEMGFDSEEKILALQNADRSDARAREVAVRDKMPMILAAIVVASTLILEGIILFHGTPANVDGVVLGRVLGNLDAGMIMVLSYYFGSSAGSRAKDGTILQQASNVIEFKKAA